MPAASKPRKYQVAVDTREKLPYEWEDIKCVSTTLSAGDYSIIGMESVVAVERKSFADFYGCLTDNRERFEISLHRLAACRYPLVVIESSMTDLSKPFIYVGTGGIARRSQVPPLAAQNSLLSWQSRYRIPMLLCGDRKGGAKMTLQHLDVVWRLEREDEREAGRRDAGT